MDGSGDGVVAQASMERVQPLPDRQTARETIMAFEAGLRRMLDVDGFTSPDCPLTHHFAPGSYGREIALPAGSLVVGKIHREAHLNMLMQGRVSVATEDGVETFAAPRVFVSSPGTKRVVYAHEDSIWVTVHVTADTDLAVIEQQMIAPTYADYELGKQEVIE